MKKSNRNAEIFDLFNSGHTCLEIGEKFNISRQRVHQIICTSGARARVQLRHAIAAAKKTYAKEKP